MEVRMGTSARRVAGGVRRGPSEVDEAVHLRAGELLREVAMTVLVDAGLMPPRC
jgi:hypothetical protein